MATVNDWNKYINAVHELALVEDDLRTILATSNVPAVRLVVDVVLYERF